MARGWGTYLSDEGMKKLVVEGTCFQTQAKLQESCGVAPGTMCAAVVIAVEGGKINGSKWPLIGDLAW